MTRQFEVFNGEQLITIVTAQRSFVGSDGRLSFYNKLVGERFGETVAGFASGTWTRFNEALPPTNGNTGTSE